MNLGDINVRYYGEKYPRTVRESVSLRSKIIPINATLTATGTAENLVNLNDNLPPAVNILLNPFLSGTQNDADASGWSRDDVRVLDRGLVTTNATINGVNYTPTYGTAMYQIHRDTVASDEYGGGGIVQTIQHPSPGKYAATVRLAGYSLDTSSEPYTAGIAVWNHDGALNTAYTDPNRSFATVATNAIDDFTDVTLIHTIPENTEAVTIYVGFMDADLINTGVTSNTDDLTEGIVVDAVQFEPDFGIFDGSFSARELDYHAPTFTGFVDPSTDRYSRYTGGTTNLNSLSVRETSIKEIMYVHLRAFASETDDVGGDVYIDFDRDATARGLYLPEGQTFSQALLVNDRISFLNAEASHTPIVRGYVLGQ